MTASEYTKGQIALACWRAAKTELHSAMLSVCMVFQNRVKNGWFEGSLYLNAVHWLAENPGEFPDERDPQFLQLLTKMDAVILELIPDKTGGALWFYPKTEEEVRLPDGYSITTTIGGITFVR